MLNAIHVSVLSAFITSQQVHYLSNYLSAGNLTNNLKYMLNKHLSLPKMYRF